MEPSGGPGPGPVPVPGNNKGRGGAAAPGRGRDLARPPRKDSEVSAAGSGAAFPGGAGRAGPLPGPAHGCRCPGAVPVSGRCRCPLAPVLVDLCGCRCPGVPVPVVPVLRGASVRLFQPCLGTAFPGTSPGPARPLAPVLRCCSWARSWTGLSLGIASLAQWPRAVEPRGLSARPTGNWGCPDPAWSRSVPVSPSSIPSPRPDRCDRAGARGWLGPPVANGSDRAGPGVSQPIRGVSRCYRSVPALSGVSSRRARSWDGYSRSWPTAPGTPRGPGVTLSLGSQICVELRYPGAFPKHFVHGMASEPFAARGCQKSPWNARGGM